MCPEAVPKKPSLVNAALSVLQRRMDKTIRRYANFDELKDDAYRYWQSRPAHERLDAAAELSFSQSLLKEPARNVQPGLQRVYSILKR